MLAVLVNLLGSLEPLLCLLHHTVLGRRVGRKDPLTPGSQKSSFNHVQLRESEVELVVAAIY